jgi:hypothetical protein
MRVHTVSYEGIQLEENSMMTTLSYKVLDVNPHDEDWSAYLENVLLQQAEEGWELVTAFQRQHEATQVGSTTVHVPSLVSTVLIFKRAGELRFRG